MVPVSRVRPGARPCGRQDSHGGYALLQEEFATKPLPAEKTRIVAKIPQGARMETGRIETDASCHPTVRLRLPIFNTENTKNPRSFTEKSSIALRAKRLKSPDGANGP